MTTIALTPKPPYYAVIFTSIITGDDTDGYDQLADKMFELAVQQPGFLGVESAREDVGITVSYWRDVESIQHWKNDVTHLSAQHAGQEKWYSQYKVRISKVERDYFFDKNGFE